MSVWVVRVWTRCQGPFLLVATDMAVYKNVPRFIQKHVAFQSDLPVFVRWVRAEIRDDVVFRLAPLILTGRGVSELGSERAASFRNAVTVLGELTMLTK